MPREVWCISIQHLSFAGNATLKAQATPLLHKSLFETAKKVPNPRPEEVAAGRKTVYDTWVKMIPSEVDGLPQ